MIQEECEEKNKLVTVNNEDLFIFREHIYLLLFLRVENFKKLIILSLLFATIRLTNHNIYKYLINYLHPLNKKINKNYNLSNINEIIYNNNIFYNELSKNNNFLFDLNDKNNRNLSGTNLLILNYSNEMYNNSINTNFNYFTIKDELFWSNKSINYNKIQEEILKYKCNHFKISFENKEDFY